MTHRVASLLALALLTGCAPSSQYCSIFPADSSCEAAAEQKQQAEYQAQFAAQRAAQDAANAEREREQAAQEKKAQAEEKAARKAQIAAENAPDNTCRDPAMVRNLIEQMNTFPSLVSRGFQVVNITHITTPNVPGKVVCRGLYWFSDGEEVPGTLTFMPNSAGDTMGTWQPGPFIAY